MALASFRRRVAFLPPRVADRDVFRAVLDDNQRHLMIRLRTELREFEARYEIPSDSVQQAITDGRLRDTEDVCNWVIAWESYCAARQAGPARVE